ncbi:MAG: ABC transporter ATP-binding protein [Bacteroidaceae bacterium]|nr:ABC transporter ATP-binding protein [Bacteroidaceae bacterium]
MEDNKLIHIDHATFAYDNNVALQDVTLTIYDHDFLGVIGPNGGGKTTLVKLILGIMQPQQGSVTYYDVDGRPAQSIPIGYLPQYTTFDFRFPITVEEVVKAGMLAGKSMTYRFTAKDRQRAQEMLQLMELDTLAHRPIGELSGGQRQRVLMARALATQPRLLVLDEPSTYIDRDSENQMYSMLKTLNKQCAIVLVSHDMGAVIQTVRNIACVNGTVHYHPATEPADHWFEHEIGCPLELVAHGHVPHRVLSEH